MTLQRDPDAHTAEQGPPTPPEPTLPYGTDHPDTDTWLDRDNRIHHGDGPYRHRPTRRLRRRIGDTVRRWRR